MDNIIKSFNVRATLYSDIWDNAGSDDFKTIKLHKDVREHLISIAKDFIESLGIDTFVIEDILFVGSLANYNWSEYSDVDLHIVIDKEAVNSSIEELSAVSGDAFYFRSDIRNSSDERQFLFKKLNNSNTHLVKDHSEEFIIDLNDRDMNLFLKKTSDVVKIKRSFIDTIP